MAQKPIRGAEKQDVVTTREAMRFVGAPATGHRVLVVDDDQIVRTLLNRYLALDGYIVETAASADEAYSTINERPPDLIVLDVLLAADDGLEMLTRLRRKSQVAVILLTSQGGESDRIMGLQLGADDYIVKPFSPAEVAARIASVLRRVKPSVTKTLKFDGLTIELGTREVHVDGTLVALTAMEFDLLAFLAASPRQVFSHDQLLEHVWNSSAQWQSTDTVTEHIRRLRKRIEADPEHPKWLVTVWGVGYRFSG